MVDGGAAAIVPWAGGVESFESGSGGAFVTRPMIVPMGTGPNCRLSTEALV